MKHAQALIVIVIAMSMSSCVSTTWFAPEYDQQYYLAEDVNKYSATSFTGLYSVWFTGPERVDTIASATIPDTGGTLFKKGCPVRILKLLRVSGVDASSSEAKLQIVERESKSTYIVWVRWPGAKSLLTTDLPNPP